MMRGSGFPPLLRFFVPLQTLQRGTPSPGFSSLGSLVTSVTDLGLPDVCYISTCSFTMNFI